MPVLVSPTVIPFADLLTRPNVDAIFALQISGLPYIFSNWRAPQRWTITSAVNLDGEVYDWLPILNLGKDFAQVSTKVEPKAGLGDCGNLSFSLKLPGTQKATLGNDLLSILTNAVFRTDGKNSMSLTSELDVDDTGAKVLSFYSQPYPTSGDVPDFLYFGTETITVNSVSSVSATQISANISRGTFKSQRRYHTGAINGGDKANGGGYIVADYPLVLEGRIARLWMIPGEFSRENTTWSFRPHAVSFTSDGSNKLIYAGIVDGVAEDVTYATVRTSSIDRLLEGDIIANPLELDLAGFIGNSAQRTFYIGDHNKYLNIEIDQTENAVNPLLVIRSFAALGVGDTFSIGSNVFTCVAAAPATFQFVKAANVISTYYNIALAINTAIGVGTSPYICQASSGLYGVHLYYSNDIDASPSSSYDLTSSDSTAITFSAPTLEETRFLTYTNLELVRSDNDDGESPFSPVTAGRYTDREISQFLCDTLASVMSHPFTFSGGFVLDFTSDTEFRYTLNLTTEPFIVTRGWKVRLYPHWGNNTSFIKDLGFTSEGAVECTGAEGSPGFFTAKADKKPAKFRWPKGNLAKPDRIYVKPARDQYTEDNFIVSDWLDDEGNSILPHAYIKDVGIIKFTTYDVASGYLSGVEAAEFNLGTKEEVYIEDTGFEEAETEAKIQRVVALPNTSVQRAFLYLLLGGSGVGNTNHATYDKGWRGAGLNIPSDLIDVTSFTSTQRVIRDQIVWMKGDDVRKFIEPELVSSQLQLVCSLGELYMIEIQPIIEASDTAVHTIDSSKIVTLNSRPYAIDRQTNRVINAMNIKAGYSYSSGKFNLEVFNRQQDSINTYGQKQIISLELKSISSNEDANQTVANISQSIFALYSRPYAIIELDLAVKESLLYRIGDIVSITHPHIPKPTSAERGIEGVLGRILVQESNFTGESGKFSSITVVVYDYRGQRYSQWTPSCRVNVTAGPTYTAVDHTYSNAADASDLSYFLDEMWVNCHDYQDPTSFVTRRITSITGNVLTFNAAMTGNDFAMVYPDYDYANTSDTQRKYIYFGDASNTLDTYTDTVSAFSFA